jgi:hypothetical protein
MLNFVIGHCHLKSSLLPSLCKMSSVSATAGTDILESHVGRSVIVPELKTSRKWHAERTVVWFLSRNSKARFCLLLRPSRGSFGGFWLHLTVPGTQTNATVFTCWWATKAQTLQRSATCPSPLLEIAGMFHTRGLTYQWYPKWYFISIYWQFCKLSYFCLCDMEGRPGRSQSSTEVSPCLNQKTAQILPMELSLIAVWSISCVSDADFQSLKQNLMQTCRSFKSQTALTSHNNKHP